MQEYWSKEFPTMLHLHWEPPAYQENDTSKSFLPKDCTVAVKDAKKWYSHLFEYELHIGQVFVYIRREDPDANISRILSYGYKKYHMSSV